MEGMSILVVTEFIVAPSQREKLIRLLTELRGYTTTQTGNLTCRILEDMEDPSKVMTNEWWEYLEQWRRFQIMRETGTLYRDIGEPVEALLSAPKSVRFFYTCVA